MKPTFVKEKTHLDSRLNLKTAVESQKSAQALGAPGKIKNYLITTNVTTTFFHQARQYLTRLFCANCCF